jgi:hypothetical protein
MNNFGHYLQLGYEHIASINALDHILFILVLIATFRTRDWLKMLIAISFFTLGHTLTLTLGAFELIKVNRDLIEFLIPLSIVVTALFNLTKSGQNARNKSKYWLALVFGLLHGFGFSNAYEMLVLGEGNYWQAILPFNLGIELGQVLVWFLSFCLMLIITQIFQAKQRDWNLFVSGIGFGLATYMCLENWIF